MSLNKKKLTEKYLNKLKRVTDRHIQKIEEIKQIHNNNKRLSIILENKNKNHSENVKKIRDQFLQNKALIDKKKQPSVENIGNKYALLIGINYVNTSSELSGCINDVTNVSQKLSAAYNFNNITMLTDNTDVKPTYDNILNEFKNLLVNSKAGDTLFFQYSGHGSYTRDTNKDETDGYDELIIPVDFIPIKDDVLKKTIEDYLPENVKLFALFDSCYSGTVMDLRYNYLDSLNYNKLTENKRVPILNRDVIMLSGCNDNQISADAYINNTFQGAMSWAFIETLNSNPLISWNTLLQNMRGLLKKKRFKQLPQLSSAKMMDIQTLVSF